MKLVQKWEIVYVGGHGGQVLVKENMETRHCFEKERERNALSRDFFIDMWYERCPPNEVVAMLSVGSNEAM